MRRKSRAKPPSPFRRFNSSLEVIRLVVMMYVRFPLSLRNVEDLLLALAPRRDVREAQRRDGLPLASGGSRGGSPRELHHEEPRQGRRPRLHEEGAEATRLSRVDHHRRSSVVQGRNDLGNAEKQEIGRWANNRVENSHLPLRRRERAMLRFRRMKTLQKFASVHANVHNHFNLERHLVDRTTYKKRRSAALAEWQSLAS
jgi:putative transposase